MLTFINGNYIATFEFYTIDKEGSLSIIRDGTGDNGEIIKDGLTRKDFEFISMDVSFKLNKIPTVLINSKCRNIEKAKQIKCFYVDIKTLHNDSTSKQDIVDLSFWASTRSTETLNSWDTKFYCFMSYPNIMFNYSSNYLNGESLFNVIEELNKNKILYQETSLNAKKYLTSINLNEHCFEYGPWYTYLENIMRLSERPIYLYFKGLHVLGEQFSGDDTNFKIELISPNVRMSSKNEIHTEEVNPTLKITNITNPSGNSIGVVYTSNIKNESINKSYLLVHDFDSAAYNFFKNKNLWSFQLMFGFKSNSPCFIGMGDFVVVYSSIDGGMVPGYVIEETLHFTHKIYGDYVIGANKNKDLIVKLEEDSSLEIKNNKDKK